jgi:5-methylcytosine-specific restriction endonuclease McrA
VEPEDAAVSTIAEYRATEWFQRHLETHPFSIRGCYLCERPAWLAKQDEAMERQVADAAAIHDCPLRDPSVRGIPGHELWGRRCYMCGKQLRDPAAVRAERRRRWCSDACSTLYWANHGWSTASAAAIRRDDHRCVRCGARDGELRDVCGSRRCRQPWPCEAERTYGPGLAGHWAVTSGVAIEVNHIIPRVGRGYHESCAHHLDLLETLCHECHVKVTTQQGRERRERRDGGANLTLELPGA